MGSGVWARVEPWGVHKTHKVEVLTLQVGRAGPRRHGWEAGSLEAEVE